MGNDPNADDEIIVLDPNFATGIPWNFGIGWSLVANQAVFLKGIPAQGFIDQTLAACVPGNQYTITFDITNFAVINPAGGLQVFYGSQGGVIYQGVATHVSVIIALTSLASLRFNPELVAIGDTITIDNVSIIPDGDFVMEVLGIGAGNGGSPVTDDDPAVGADRIHLIHNENGATQIGILYDRP